MSITSVLALVREALPLFGIDAAAGITFIKQRENHVFRVQSAEHDCAVRVHRRGYREGAQLECESNHLRALRTAGLLVPDPLESVSGGYAVAVDGDQRLLSAQHWLPAATPIADSFEVFTGVGTVHEYDMGRLGSAMAQHHLHAESAPVPADFSRPAWDLPGLLGPEALWGDGTELWSLLPAERLSLKKAAEAAASVIEGLGTDRSMFGAIHADMTFENVLTTREGLAVIDFDDFGEGWFGFDVATALFFATPHRDYPALEGAFFEGYEQVRPLDRSVSHGLDAFMLARGLSYLGWAADRPGDPASDFAAGRVAPWVAKAASTFTSSGSTGWTAKTNYSKEN
jgi:Ser/Thr protein kinase RdoA (MazF antagonist)